MVPGVDFGSILAPFWSPLGSLWAPFGLFGETLDSIWALLGGMLGSVGLPWVIFRRPESKKGAQKGLSWDFHGIFKDFIVFL